MLCLCLCLFGSFGIDAHPVEQIAGRWTSPPQHVPTKGVPDGPLLGNGRFGAVLTWSEQDAQVEFHFGHNSFFAAPTSGISSCGYAAGGRKALGGLRLHFPTKGAAVAVQWPANATAAVRFEANGETTGLMSFIHAEEDVLAVQLVSSESLEASAELWTYSGCNGPQRPMVKSEVHAKPTKRVFQVTSATTDRLPTTIGAGLDGIEVSRANGWPYQSDLFPVEWFSLRAAVQSGFSSALVTGSCGARRGPCSLGKFRLAPGETKTLQVVLQRWSLRGEAPPMPQVRPLYELGIKHAQVWGEYWSESFLQFPRSRITEFYWYMSQYIMKASSGGDAAPGLFGPFVLDDEVSWAGDVTLNYNSEAVYYAAGASNHLTAFEPYFQTILEYLPVAKRLALQVSPNCKGALHFPGHILPKGVNSGDKGDMGQKQMGLFAAVPFILYWRYTRNAHFAERALPLLQGLASFWECNLSPGEDGRLHDAMDCAEELCIPDGDMQPDPSVVLSLLPHLFHSLADMSEVVGAGDQEKWRRWRAIAKLIASYPTEVVDGQKVIADFAGGEGAWGLALRFHAGGSVAWSGPFAAFPLGTIGLASEKKKVDLVHRSLDRFFSVWPGGKQGNSFPHIFAGAARVGWQPDLLFQLWEAYLTNTTDLKCRMFPNGMVLGCGGTGLENVGGAAYVNEMLLQSHEGVIRLFPTIPVGFPARFSLRAVGGFLVSGQHTEQGTIADVVITAPRDSAADGTKVAIPKQCAVKSPWGQVPVLVNGAVVESGDDDIVRFPVQSGVVYVLAPRQLEQIKGTDLHQKSH